MFSLFLGLDVGGTFTDAVLIADGKIVAKAKKRTTHADIAIGVLEALDAIMQACPDASQIQRVTLSTTLITNAVTTGHLPQVDIYVIPGPGINCEHSFPVEPIILPGYTDHRGKLTAPTLYENRLKKASSAVVCAKFATRNAQSERELKDKLAKYDVHNIVMGHEMSGQLGFIRRTNSAYFTAATSELFQNFIATIKDGLQKLSVSAPLYALKADGGVMPTAWLEKHTIEAYFTGPAASVMGIKSLLNPAKNCISLDIGGTTTDIAFWSDTLPLYAKRGTKIKTFPTSVRALHLRSIGIGGDSLIESSSGQIIFGARRGGSAMALGGQQPTLTDAFLLLGYDDFGDREKAKRAMQMLSINEETPEQTAQKVLDTATGQIIAAIEEMIEEHALEPVYRVEDIVGAQQFIPQLIIGVGGAAAGIVPRVAKLLDLEYEIPQNAFIANAIGAAAAQATLTADLRADTAAGECILSQTGQRTKINSSFSLYDAQKMLTEQLERQAQELGIKYLGSEVVWQEEFPVIRDSWRSGSIINLSMQLKPGVLFSVQGGDARCSL